VHSSNTKSVSFFIKKVVERYRSYLQNHFFANRARDRPLGSGNFSFFIQWKNDKATGNGKIDLILQEWFCPRDFNFCRLNERCCTRKRWYFLCSYESSMFPQFVRERVIITRSRYEIFMVGGIWKDSKQPRTLRRD
jgi:hypothetical protein